MSIDPYKSKEKYLRWKAKTINGIPDMSKQNSDIIKQYLADMEIGRNIAISNKKGARGFMRLNSLRFRMMFLAKKFEEKYSVLDITSITEDQLLNFFSQMRNGELRKSNGETYKSAQDFCNAFKAFWHWHQKVSHKNGKQIEDITIYLDTSGDKPLWVYLDEEQVKMLADKAKYEYRVLMWFLLDTGIRAPTELVNLKVSDLKNNCKELDIRISKTFPRKIKLMLTTDLIQGYIKDKQLKFDDYLFPINPIVANRYLKRLAYRVFGDGKSQAGELYSKLTLYDFRHISCCYWLPRYKSESALKYRFGWKKSDKIHYYSELLGMKDTISEDDMLLDLTKTEIEKRLEKSEKDKEILSERLISLEKDLNKLKQQLEEKQKTIENQTKTN